MTLIPVFEFERAGRLVAQQHRGTLRDGAGNRDTLLLAAGKLCRKMMHAPLEPDQLKGFVRTHRTLRNLGHQRHVLVGGQTRNEVIELEYEPDMPRR